MTLTGIKRGTALAAMSLLIAACSAAPAGPTSGGSPAGSAAATAPVSSAASQPAASGAAGGKSFSVAFTSIGMSSTGFLSALDKLRGQGYTIETPEIAESELVTEGTASGTFAFGSGANNAVLAAVENGANLKAVVDRISNEWTIYGRTATITECADLDGKRLAIHSEGAVSTAMVRNYIETECESTEPEYIVIEGSPNRLAALLADQIDASPLELTDATTLEAQAGDRFSLLTSLSESLPELRTTSVYVNGDFATQNPDTVRDVVKAVIEEYRLIDGDAAYLKQIAQKYAPDAINADTIDAAVEQYIERGMFPVNGGITEENLEYTSNFFGPEGTGSTEAVVPVAEWADLSYLNAVLDELGRQ